MGMEKGAMEGRGKERRGWAETEGRTQHWKGSWSRAADWLRPALGTGTDSEL